MIFQNACKFVLQCTSWGFSTVPGFCRTVCILRRTWMVYCLQLVLLLTTRTSAGAPSPCTCWPRCAARWRWSSRSRRRWTSWTACSPNCSSAPRGPSSSTSSHRGPWRRAWKEGIYTKYKSYPLQSFFVNKSKRSLPSTISGDEHDASSHDDKQGLERYCLWSYIDTFWLRGRSKNVKNDL